MNFLIEKSAALDAYLPSLPSIPTPISATYIIPTSFPPSPIPHVILPVNYLIPIVSIAFYLGEHLQHITDVALVAIVKNFNFNSSVS